MTSSRQSGDAAISTARSDSAPRQTAAAPATDELARRAQLLESLGVAVYVTDAAGVITDYNQAAADLWGRRPAVGQDEWCGSWKLYEPDGTPMSHDECPMALTLKEHRPVRGREAMAERPDGSRVRFIPYPTPLHGEAGELIGAVNVLIDVTDQRSAERALSENEGRLREALEAKDEFLGLVSHELKTPITTIMGNAKVLTRSTTPINDDDRHAALLDIAGEAERLRAIIDDLLVLARSEHRKPPEFEPVAVLRIVEQAVAAVRRKHPGRKIESACEGEHALLTADESYIRQVVENLLSNAIKYSSGQIDVVAVSGDYAVRVRVRDRGRGIPQEERERVFDTFYRSPATLRMASGVGLGLAVCKRLVALMGGEMWVCDRPGGGAEVGFSLPVLPSEAA